MVGVNEIKYFNKYFKEEFGVTPTQYRKRRLYPGSRGSVWKEKRAGYGLPEL
jgi:AraC-like DNA-binding protein